MKKLISILICISLLFGFSFTAYSEDGAVTGYYMYVGLKYMSTAVSSVSFSSETGFVLAEAGRNGYTVSGDYSGYTSLKALPNGSSVDIYDESGNLVISDMPNTMVLMAVGAEDERYVTVDGKVYRDGVIFGSYGDGRLAVVNYVTLEHYCWGVLNNELGYYNPLEALKAQAVAVRSFALTRESVHAGGAVSFDVCTTSHCQVYGGVSSEKEKTTQACRETEGLVLTYNGKVCTAYYHAYNFGYTLSCEQQWTADVGYAKSVYDPYGSEHKWSTQFSFDEIEERLAARGRSVGTLESVYVGERYSNGAVKSLVFTGSDGTVTVSKSTIMSYFNLKSLGFSISASPDPVIIQDGSGSSSVSVQGSGESSLCTDTICVVGADGVVTEISLPGMVISDGSEQITVTETASAQQGPQFTDEVVTGGMLYLAGLGYGHCVGMNQSGAKNMANLGFGYDEILKFYYTGVEIQNFEEIF